MSDEQSKVAQAWDESGRYWDKYGQTIRAMFEPISLALLEAAHIGENHRVLDVAAGVGEPSLTIATRAPSTHVYCTDPASSMIRGAKKEAARLHLANVHCAQCVADALPFRDACFDAVVCRFGVMFFPDPAGGIRELLRVVKTDGRVSCAVWAASEVNPFHYVSADIISKYVPLPLVGPDEPGAFRFAPPGKLAAVFERAGAVQVKENALRFTIEVDKSPEEFWQLRSEMSEISREKIKRLSAEDRGRLTEDALKVLPKFFSNGKMRFPAEVLIVTGTPGR